MASDIRTRSSELARVLARGVVGERDVHVVPFLHFESLGDSQFFKQFTRLWNRMEAFGPIPLEDHEFVFTRTKSEAIKEHRIALRQKINISTLVDMDHDVTSRRFRDLKFIHSTKPACTLHTIQFLEGESNSLNKAHLLLVIREQGDFTDVQCEKIIERAHITTLSKLEGPASEEEKTVLRQQIDFPLNDHMLARSIAIELGRTEYEDIRVENDEYIYDIEYRIAARSRTDPNGRLRRLAMTMFEDVKNAYINTAKQQQLHES